MSDTVEQQLRAVLDTRAADVAAGPAPLHAIDTRARQLTRRRRAMAASSAVAAVAVVIFAGAFVVGQNTAHQPTLVPGLPSVTQTGPAVPTSRPTVTSLAPTTPIRSQPDAVRRYLETADLSRQAGIVTSFHGRLYCGLKILGHSPDGTHLFTWVLCMEYYNNAGVAKAGSGTSEALLVNVTGSGAGTVVHSVEAPQDGAAYGTSIRRLFDKPSADIALSGKPIPLDQPAQALLARARADLAAGTLPPR